jgi:hypothetical protein
MMSKLGYLTAIMRIVNTWIETNGYQGFGLSTKRKNGEVLYALTPWDAQLVIYGTYEEIRDVLWIMLQECDPTAP